jgi:hypothetical protein
MFHKVDSVCLTKAIADTCDQISYVLLKSDLQVQQIVETTDSVTKSVGIIDFKRVTL